MAADFHEQRVKMVDGQIRTTDVTDAAVLAAMLAVPREEFVPAHWRPLAYIDEDIEIAPAGDGAGARFLMEPSPFARLVQLAAVTGGDTVLDIGCGTGYSSAVLSRIAAAVVGLESDAALAAAARDALAAHGRGNVEIVEGPLAQGHAARAPYDVVIVNGAADELPSALFDQLAEGGRLVAVIGHGHAGRATLYLKEGGLVSQRRVFNAAVMPLAEFRRQPEFEF